MSLFLLFMSGCSSQSPVNSISPLRSPVTIRVKVTSAPIKTPIAIPIQVLRITPTQDPLLASIYGRLVTDKPLVTPISDTTIYVSQVIGDLSKDVPPAVLVQFNKDPLGIVDAQGNFRINNISPGQYALSAVPHGRAVEFYQIHVPKSLGGPYLILKAGQVVDLGKLDVDFTPVAPQGSQ